jgi:hypothetical protein
VNFLHELAVRNFFLKEGAGSQPRAIGAAPGDKEVALIDENPQAFTVGGGQLDPHDEHAGDIVDHNIGIWLPNGA